MLQLLERLLLTGDWAPFFLHRPDLVLAACHISTQAREGGAKRWKCPRTDMRNPIIRLSCLVDCTLAKVDSALAMPSFDRGAVQPRRSCGTFASKYREMIDQCAILLS